MSSSASSPFAVSYPASLQDRLELKNGRVVDVSMGQYYPEGVRLILENGKIASMPGLPGAPEIAADLSIDLQGRAVIPGLFNTHSHIQMKYPTILAGLSDLGAMKKFTQAQIEKSMADCLLHGVTHVRDALTTDLRHNSRLGERIERREIPGPRLYRSVLVSQMGGVYTTPGGLFGKLMGLLTGSPALEYDDAASGVVAFPANASEAEVRSAVDQAIDERGAQTIKLYDQREFVPSYRPGATLMTLAQMEAAASQARRRGIPVTLHHVNVESFRRGVHSGVTSLAHLPGDEALTPDDIQAFIHGGCLIEPTLSVVFYLAWEMPGAAWNGHPRLIQIEALRQAHAARLVDEFWRPELAPSAKSHFERARQGKFKLMGVMDFAPTFRYWGSLVGTGMENLRELYHAGGWVACGLDAGATPAAEGMVGLELSMLRLALAGCGPEFSGAQALRSATLLSAVALGVEDRFGTVETGKVADLAILDGDPLADPGLIGTPVAALFKEGELVVDACDLSTESQ